MSAKDISKAFSSTRRATSGPVREREILRFSSSLFVADSKKASANLRSIILGWAARQVGGTFPDEAERGEGFEYLSGGRVCIGTGFEEERRSFWAIRVDRPDTAIAQRVWTTEVVLGYVPGKQEVLFCARLLVSTPESFLDIAPAVPAVVRDVVDNYALGYNGYSIRPYLWHVIEESDAETLVDELVSPARGLPYVVCSIMEGFNQSLIKVSSLVRALLGMAKVVVVGDRASWVLTRRFGKRLSTYAGAVRVYLPGFSYDANPYDHRLFILLAKSSGKFVASEIRRFVALESLRRLRLGEDVVEFSAVRGVALEADRERLLKSGAADSESLRVANKQIEALKEDLRSSHAAQQWFSDEHAKAEAEVSRLKSKLDSAEHRISQLSIQLKEKGADPDAGLDLPTRWDLFADWCDDVLSDRVELSGRARRETKNAEFEDVKTAASCLLWLANEYREARLSGVGDDLRKPIVEGVRNDRCGGDSFVFDWKGRKRSVDWHIKNGGNTRDPGRCLRIYYFWDEIEEIVVIASMPAHLRTGAS